MLVERALSGVSISHINIYLFILFSIDFDLISSSKYFVCSHKKKLPLTISELAKRADDAPYVDLTVFIDDDDDDDDDDEDKEDEDEEDEEESGGPSIRFYF